MNNKELRNLVMRHPETIGMVTIASIFIVGIFLGGMIITRLS